MHKHEGPHRTPPRPGDALLQCDCAPPVAALSSLILGTGLLPPDAWVVDLVLTAPAVVRSPTALSRSDIPHSPPPKR